MMITCPHCGHTGIPLTKKSGPHIAAACFKCERHIKFLPQNPVTDDFVLYFGKFKGRNVKSMVGSTKEEYQYLCWLLENSTNLKPQQILILQKLVK